MATLLKQGSAVSKLDTIHYKVNTNNNKWLNEHNYYSVVHIVQFYKSALTLRTERHLWLQRKHKRMLFSYDINLIFGVVSGLTTHFRYYSATSTSAATMLTVIIITIDVIAVDIMCILKKKCKSGIRYPMKVLRS